MMENNERFSVVLMNPPYSGGLHLDFMQKSINLLSDKGCMVIIEPAQLYITLRKNGKYRKEGSTYKKLYDKLKVEKHIKEVQIENFNTSFNIRNKTALAITYYDNNKQYDKISFENCGYRTIVSSLDDINYVGNGQLTHSILDKCLSYREHMIEHCIKLKNYKQYENKGYYFNRYGNYMINTVGSPGVDEVDKIINSCYIETPLGAYLNSYFLNYSSKIQYNTVPLSKRGNPCDCVYGPKEEIENWQFYNFNNKLPLFINICLTIDENNNSREYTPWLVNKKYTDEEIYNILNITKEEQEFIDYTIKKFERSSPWFRRYAGNLSITDEEIKKYLKE